MICRHCSRNKVNRPRGLCWSCYYTPGLKEQYPVTSKFAPRGEQTAAELDAMIAAQRANLPDWWNEGHRGVGYDVQGRAPQPKRTQADPPRMPRRSRRAGKK